MDPITLSLIIGGGLSALGMGGSLLQGRAAAKQGKKAQQAMLDAMRSQTGISSEYLSAYKKAMEEAKNANEFRYSEILKARDESIEKAKGTIEQGKVADRAVAAQAISDSTSSKGFGGASRSSVKKGAKRAAKDASARVENQAKANRLQLVTPMQENAASFVERRDDLYPDENLLGIASQLGAGSVPVGGNEGSGLGGILQLLGQFGPLATQLLPLLLPGGGGAAAAGSITPAMMQGMMAHGLPASASNPTVRHGLATGRLPSAAIRPLWNQPV